MSGVLRGCGVCAIAAVAALALLVSPARAAAQPLVDHHQHLFSPAVTGVSGLKPVDAGELVALLDAAGIQRAVILSTAYQFGNPNRPLIRDEEAQVRAENDWTSQQVARFPDRLRAFCGVNPLKDYALGEIARCAKDPHLRLGLKLHFGNSDIDLTNPTHLEQMRRVFRAANERGMAIMVHLRTSVTRKRPYGAAYAKAFLNELLPAAPDVTVQIAHLAGAGGYDDPLVDDAVSVFVAAVANKDPRMARVYIDVSGVWLGDWKAHAAEMAARIRALGVERILYGSDGATGGNAPSEAWAAFRQLPLTEAEFRTIAANVAPYLTSR